MNVDRLDRKDFAGRMEALEKQDRLEDEAPGETLDDEERRDRMETKVFLDHAEVLVPEH